VVTTDDANAFIEVTRRKKRSRTTTASHSLLVQSDQQRSNDSVNNKRDKLKIVGKLNANDSKIKVSQVLIDKPVYCVSNISVDYNYQDNLCDAYCFPVLLYGSKVMMLNNSQKTII
jgi:hypothetical protein